MFTARYGLSPYITLIRFVLKGLLLDEIQGVSFMILCSANRIEVFTTVNVKVKVF